MILLPKRFRFSLKVTITCILLASVMIWASRWQWRRYNEKIALVKTYEANESADAVPLPTNLTEADIDRLADRRVRISGTYDLTRQLIVTNKKHATGPGHWLLTPFKLDNSDKSILVSRGFIPFADRTPDTWKKYDAAPHDSFDAVLKQSISPHVLGPSNPETGKDLEFKHLFFFEEVPKMAAQLPYPVMDKIFVERIPPPPQGQFPAPIISVEIPPSTHFGYTIEWMLLAAATLLTGFIIQAFPRGRRVKPDIDGFEPDRHNNSQLH